MNKLPSPSEKQVQAAVRGYLEYKGYLVFRMNSGAIRSYRANGRQDLIRLMPIGTPDLMAFKIKRKNIYLNQEDITINEINLLFIEVKTHPNKPSQIQLNKMQELESYGAKCLVVYSIDDLEKAGI